MQNKTSSMQNITLKNAENMRLPVIREAHLAIFENLKLSMILQKQNILCILYIF